MVHNENIVQNFKPAQCMHATHTHTHTHTQGATE